jgi:hypothetical protein
VMRGWMMCYNQILMIVCGARVRRTQRNFYFANEV